MKAALGRSLYKRLIKHSECDCVRRGRRITLIVYQGLKRKYMGKLIANSAAYALTWKVVGKDRNLRHGRRVKPPPSPWLVQ
jgi:hypothetical protein